MSQTDAHQTNVAVAEEWIDALRSLDPGRLRACWADHATIDFLFAPSGFPSRFETSQEIEELAQMFCGAVDTLDFPEVSIEPLADGRKVLLEFKGEGKLTNGNPYRNTYVAIFEIEDGKIVGHREYFDPLVVIEAFELDAAAG